MPTTLRPPVGLKGPVRAVSRGPHHWLWLGAVVIAAVVVGLASWRLVDRFAGGSVSKEETPVSVEVQPATAVMVAGLQRLLQAEGYSLVATGTFDPVTRSAAADYLRADDLLGSPGLASSLRGTVLTGRHDPGAWNARFGVDRRTQMVERPLTGPGGQLDAFGNLNPPQ